MKTPREEKLGEKKTNHEATRKRRQTEESSKTENNETVNERFTRPERRTLIKTIEKNKTEGEAKKEIPGAQSIEFETSERR